MKSVSGRGKKVKVRKGKKSSRLRRPPTRTKAKLVRKKKRKPKQVVEEVLVPTPVADDVEYDYLDYVDYVYDYDDYSERGVISNGRLDKQYISTDSRVWRVNVHV